MQTKENEEKSHGFRRLNMSQRNAQITVCVMITHNQVYQRRSVLLENRGLTCESLEDHHHTEGNGGALQLQRHGCRHCEVVQGVRPSDCLQCLLRELFYEEKFGFIPWRFFISCGKKPSFAQLKKLSFFVGCHGPWGCRLSRSSRVDNTHAMIWIVKSKIRIIVQAVCNGLL